MPIYTATRGEVVDAPVQISTDTGLATVLVLRETRAGGSDQRVGPSADYQVCIREPDLARQALQRVWLGDTLVVLGTLHLHEITGPLEDLLCAAQVTLDAVAIGLDLDQPPDVQ